MSVIRFIGDVHGVWESDYYPHLVGVEHTVQVGDMGVGFWRDSRGGFGPPPDTSQFPGVHEYIRGNHDNPQVCAKDPHCIKDGTYKDGIYYVGGALSIDREYRTEGLSWWPDEELSIPALDRIISEYAMLRPEIVVTHDCPEDVAGAMMAAFNRIKFNDGSRTRQAFQRMLEIHQPKLWIFGHWHVSINFTYGRTRFVCLGIGETYDVEVNEYL